MEQWAKTILGLENMVRLLDNGVATPRYANTSTEKIKSVAIDMHKVVSDSRVYEIDGRMGRMFALTVNKPRKIELPFPYTFLDVDINYKGTHYYGLSLAKVKEIGMDDVLIYTLAVKVQPDGKTDEARIMDLYLNKNRGLRDDEMTKGAGGDIINILRRIVMNFADFLEHPEVKLVEHKRTNQEKRAKRGKMPLPNSTSLVVKGELRVYVDSLQPKKGESDSLDTSYEVAGHWRRFRHPRYVNKQGDKTFIHPYLKGIGTPDIKIRKIKIKRMTNIPEAI